MFVLAMTAFRVNQIPPVLFEHLDEITDFHRRPFLPLMTYTH
jgi:hypothetical protein